jgi:hypothetical protein
MGNNVGKDDGPWFKEGGGKDEDFGMSDQDEIEEWEDFESLEDRILRGPLMGVLLWTALIAGAIWIALNAYVQIRQARVRGATIHFTPLSCGFVVPAVCRPGRQGCRRADHCRPPAATFREPSLSGKHSTLEPVVAPSQAGQAQTGQLPHCGRPSVLGARKDSKASMR